MFRTGNHPTLPALLEFILTLAVTISPEPVTTMAQSAASNDTCIRPIRSYVVDPPTDLLRSHLAGREVDLGGLQAAFHDRNDAIPSRAAVWGVPGLGKTQLALKYASESAHCYSHIFWISAATAGKILEGYDTILDLLESPERFASEQHLRLAAVKRWLEDEDGEEPRTWLLVFDNATGGTVSTLREVLPTRNSRGKILFTARSEAVARALTSIDGGEHYCKELSSLSVTEASSVLCRSAGIRPDTSIVLEPSVELAKLLGLLPLAIDQAASIIKQSRFGVESLLRIFSDRVSGLPTVFYTSDKVKSRCLQLPEAPQMESRAADFFRRCNLCDGICGPADFLS